MKFADRLKQTTTATSTATVSLGAAVTGFQSVAGAIGAGQLAVGDTAPFCVTDGSNWEISTYTVTDAATLTRVAVQSSSNNGAAVTFATGSKDIFCVVSMASLAAGLLNPDDAGFDIVLCAGQSNMEGNPASDPLIDIGDPRVWQWSTPLGDPTRHTILSGADPLYMMTGVRTGKTGPATWFAKAYLSTVPQNRKVLLVPVAAGSTGLVGNFWQPGSPGGQGYSTAISECNLAIAAAQAWYPNSRFVGTIWAQGEADALANIPQWQYAMNLKAMIAGFRSGITGASKSWFVISQMTPEGMSAEPREAVIDLAHKQVVAEVDRCAFVLSVSGMAAGVHYTAPGIRIMGQRMGLAVAKAKLSVGVDATPPVIVAATVANASPTSVAVTLSEVLDATSPPAASAFTIAGHTISAVSISGNIITLTVAEAFTYGETRSVVYTKPATNPVKDLAGNALATAATFAITNSVAQVGGDTTPPGTPTAAIADAAPKNIVMTFNEALSGSAPSNAAFTVGGVANSVSGVAISGNTCTVTVATAYTNGQTVTITYTPTGTNDLQDAAGNKVVAFGPIAVTNNAGAPAQAITVNTPATQTVGTAFAVTGTYANGTPTALDYRLSDDPAGQWTQVATATISGGNFSFSVTPATASAGRTISVRDRTTQVSGTSGTYAVNAAGGATTYATMSATDKDSTITVSADGLTVTGTAAGFKSARASRGVTSGKYYFEAKMAGAGRVMIGVGNASCPTNNFVGNDPSGAGTAYDSSSGNRYMYGGLPNTWATYTTNDVISVELDMDAKSVAWFKNGTLQGSYTMPAANSPWSGGVAVFPMVTTNANNSVILMNFGAAPWSRTPTAGFVGLPA
jgi:hypothetical protein